MWLKSLKVFYFQIVLLVKKKKKKELFCCVLQPKIKTVQCVYSQVEILRVLWISSDKKNMSQQVMFILLTNNNNNCVYVFLTVKSVQLVLYI